MATEEFEFQAMPMAYVQLPMTNSPSSTSESIPLPNATISFEEIKIGDKFDRLEITIKIDEDPRLKAVDVFTQYGGINFLLIKHAPRACSAGKNPMNFYAFYPNWDNWEDRVLATERSDPDEMEIPVDYETVSGLFAVGMTKETSAPTDPAVPDTDLAELAAARLVVTGLEERKAELMIEMAELTDEGELATVEQIRELINVNKEIVTAESEVAGIFQEMRRISYSKLELGMVKGQERTTDSPSYYGKEGNVVLTARFTDPEGGDEPLPWKAETTGFYMNSENPLGHYTFVFTDYHPIPLAVYSVVGYLDDAFDDHDYNPKYVPRWLALASYNPEYLKAGIITSREDGGPLASLSSGSALRGRWNIHIVKVINSLASKGSSLYQAPSYITTGLELLEYEIGRWVVIQKASNGVWYIIPTSSAYWEDAVDYFREFVPF